MGFRHSYATARFATGAGILSIQRSMCWQTCTQLPYKTAAASAIHCTDRTMHYSSTRSAWVFELILTLIYFLSICSCLLIPEDNRPVEIREYYGMSIEVDSLMGNISSLYLVEHRVCNKSFPFLLFFSCHLILIMFCLLKRLFF